MSAALCLPNPLPSKAYSAASLAHKVLKYFEGYPTVVSLTTAAIADRFDVVPAAVHSGLALALEKRHVRRDQNTEDEYVYFPGWFTPGGKVNPSFKSGADLGNGAQADLLRGALAPKPRKQREPIIDLSAIKIEVDVPVPVKEKKVTRNDWAGLIARIPAGGSVHLNMIHCANVKKYARESKRPYLVKQDPDGAKFRLWMEPVTEQV